MDSFTNTDQEEAFISAFQKRVDRFTLCSHLLWGLWGIFRGAAEKGSTEDFDYIGYGMNRMAEYQRRRNTLLIEP